MDFAEKLAAKQEESPQEIPPPPVKRKSWPLLVGSAAVLVLLGLLTGVIIKIKTANGVLVLEDLSKDAEVFVDGEKVTVTWGPDGKKAEIHVKPGTRKIVAKRDGVEVIGQEVVIADGGREVLHARLEPPGLPKAQIGDGKPPASDAKDSLDQWFAVGTKWEGKAVIADPNPVEGAVWFIVNSRDGNRFRGRAVNEWRDDMTVEGVLNDDRESFTWKFVDYVVNQWKPDRGPVEAIQASGTWKEGLVRIDLGRPGLGGNNRPRHWEFTAKKVISRREDDQKWPPALHPGKVGFIANGTWRIEGDELVQTEVVGAPTFASAIQWGDLSWEDYDLRLKAMKTGGQNGFIITFDVRANKNTDWAIGQDGNRNSYVQSVESMPDRRINFNRRTDIVPLTIVDNRWYDILIKIRGKQIECFLDGQRHFPPVTDSDRCGGLIRLNCLRMAARFKDIELRAVDGTILWKGLPKLP
jgi:hypothetical protein